MPPYATCSSPKCSYLFDFRNGEEGQITLPPEFYPVCPGKVISYCRVCFWPLLVIPRRNMPMCWNCCARLRQDEDLAGEKRAIRRTIVCAALRNAKMINRAYRDPRMVPDSISQACLLIVDLYRAEGITSVETIVHSFSLGHRKSVGVGGGAMWQRH